MEEATSADAQKTTFNILFVCTGNTCRSPLAEALARAELERRGWKNVQVRSAGVAAREGEAASGPAVTVASRRSLSLGRHRSRPLTLDVVDWADLVLAMSASHLGAIDNLGGSAKGSLLGDFAAGGEGHGRSVPDPFGGELEMYERTLETLESLVGGALDRLAPILHP